MMEVKVEGVEQLIRKASPELVAKPLRQFFEKAALYIEGQAKRNSPVDTGRLRASITHSVDSMAVPLWGKVMTDVFYAPFVEYGTRPHFPPPRALEVWAGRHGFPGPFLVCRAIARRGTKASKFMRRAWESAQGHIAGWLDDAAVAIEARWAA